VFNALRYTPFERVRVVIIGQDPYHEENQAQGLAFSVRPGVAVPPSLLNIYKELHDDVQFRLPNHGCLIPWAEQGVLLLNAVLTRARSPGQFASRQRLGKFHRRGAARRQCQEQPGGLSCCGAAMLSARPNGSTQTATRC